MDDRLVFLIRLWLFCVAALIALMVMVGGATRLTESGLSITEWNPVAGALPPLNKAQWQDEFEKYKTTTQYRELNRGMELSDFKTIYLWEWTHRLLGRVIGLAFALPFLFFAFTKNLPRSLLLKLGGILLLGGAQGVIGWWMVISGLQERVNVAPYRLAIHLTLALVIFTCIIGVALSLRQNKKAMPIHRSMWPSLLLVLVFMQIFLGGLVAGTRAGYAYNTWPLMDGGFIPSGLFVIKPWWRNFFENTGLVQFLHRFVAYLLLFLAGWNLWCVYSLPVGGGLEWGNKAALPLFIALLLQATLGITTLLSQMNLVLALAHQAGIIVVLALAVSNTYAQSIQR
jgi:cytochrome c oxidase assembly protein subunit 15